MDRVGCRGAGRRRLRVGPDLLVRASRYRKRGDELPVQTQYNLPIELALHGRAVPDRRGAVLLHRDHADRRRPGCAKTRTSPSRSIAFKWNWQFNYRRRPRPAAGQPVVHGRRDHEIPVLVAADRTRRCGSRSQLRRRHPLVLGAGDCCSSGTSSRGDDGQNKVRDRPERPRAPTSAAARSCAAPTTRMMNFEMRVVSRRSSTSSYLQAQAASAQTDRRQGAQRDRRRPPYATTTHPFDTDRTPARTVRAAGASN